MSTTLPPVDAEFGKALLADVVAKVEAGDMTGACALLRSLQPPMEGDSATHAHTLVQPGEEDSGPPVT